MTHADALHRHGWCRFAYDAALSQWVASVRPTAKRIAETPDEVSQWLRCGGTWFAGVNVLPNDGSGAVNGGPALQGEAACFAVDHFGPQRWDRAQISIIYPGYPQPMSGESPSAFRFRRDRDAAHVDGLLPVGPDRRRHLQEPHGFVLGLPLSETSAGASPIVVWEGSHKIMRGAFRTALDGIAPEGWHEVDLTEIYQAARRRCFEQCRRAVVHAQPGEAYLIDRLALHGVAPWENGAAAPEEGRMIAYFRPELTEISQWLA